MTNVQIVLNRDGVRDLLHEVGRSVCGELAQNIAASCGSGYESDVYDAGGRTVASVYTATKEAMQDNLENNTILRACGNG